MNRANLTLCVKVLCVMAFMALSLILVFGLTIEWWGPRLGTWLAEPGLAHPIQADAIVVLGSTTDRVQHGSELFEAGFAPRMAITGSSSNTYDSAMTEAARARDRAIACGIPAGSIDLLGGTSSYEDALAIKDYVERNAINSITLVSDWPHARRAAASLEAVLGESNLTFGFSAVATPYQPDNWWKSEAGIVRVLIELGQSAFYWSAHGVHTWQVGPLEADTVGLLALIVMGLVLTTITTIVMRRWALRHLLDIPNERSLHVTPTPRGGGLAVVATVVVLLVAGRAFVTESSSWQLPYVGVALGIAGLGWVDDRYQVAPTHRLIIQLLLVGVFVGALGPVYH